MRRIYSTGIYFVNEFYLHDDFGNLVLLTDEALGSNVEFLVSR